MGLPFWVPDCTLSATLQSIEPADVLALTLGRRVSPRANVPDGLVSALLVAGRPYGWLLVAGDPTDIGERLNARGWRAKAAHIAFEEASDTLETQGCYVDGLVPVWVNADATILPSASSPLRGHRRFIAALGDRRVELMETERWEELDLETWGAVA